MVSPALTRARIGRDWKRRGNQKGRFVQNFKRHSKQWGGESVRMESVAEFALGVEAGDFFYLLILKRVTCISILIPP